MDKNTLDVVVAEYIALRDKMEEKEATHKAEMAELREQQNGLSALMLKFCNEEDADGFKTKSGTVSRRIKTRYWTTDWEAMYRTISTYNVPQLLEQRIHASHMREFLEDNPEAFPPGLQVDSSYYIQVRRSTAK